MHHLTDIREMNEGQCPFLLITVYRIIVIYPSDLVIYGWSERLYNTL